MTFVFTGYSNTAGFNDPVSWLKRIEGYTGILEALAKTHVVYSIEHIDYAGEYKSGGVNYIFDGLDTKELRFPFALHNRIKNLQPDVVFINGFIFPLQVIQLRWKLGKKTRIIILHRAEHPFQGFKRVFQRLADRCVDAYLFSSSLFAGKWNRNINASKIHEVMQAASVFKYDNRTNARNLTGVNGSPVFLWVGMLIPRKDPLTVIKAFIQYASKLPAAKLYMIYHREELLKEIQELLSAHPGMDQQIILLGAKPHEELGVWYNSADFFIAASHHEGSGVALSEAMSCGCIPLTSDFISFRSMTGNGKLGLIFKTGDKDDLVKVLIDTKRLDKETERRRVLEHYKEELSFEAIARKIEQVLAAIK